MRRSIASVAVLAFVAGLAGAASATPTLDANGKCRDNGKFVANAMCAKPAGPARKCRDKVTRQFAKCGAPGTELIPLAAGKPKP